MFGEDGGLAKFRSETRTEEGALHASATIEEADIVLRDADGVETLRYPADISTTAASSFREHLVGVYGQMQQELDEHPDAQLVTLDGIEFRLIEKRSEFSRSVMGPASAHSFSAPYLYDLQPVDSIHRQYLSLDLTRYRTEDWVVGADGTETLVESSDNVLLEILKN